MNPYSSGKYNIVLEICADCGVLFVEMAVAKVEAEQRGEYMPLCINCDPQSQETVVTITQKGAEAIVAH